MLTSVELDLLEVNKRKKAFNFSLLTNSAVLVYLFYSCLLGGTLSDLPSDTVFAVPYNGIGFYTIVHQSVKACRTRNIGTKVKSLQLNLTKSMTGHHFSCVPWHPCLRNSDLVWHRCLLQFSMHCFLVD